VKWSLSSRGARESSSLVSLRLNRKLSFKALAALDASCLVLLLCKTPLGLFTSRAWLLALLGCPLYALNMAWWRLTVDFVLWVIRQRSFNKWAAARLAPS